MTKALNKLLMNGHFELCPILNPESRFDRETCTCGHTEGVKILNTFNSKMGGA